MGSQLLQEKDGVVCGLCREPWESSELGGPVQSSKGSQHRERESSRRGGQQGLETGRGNRAPCPAWPPRVASPSACTVCAYVAHTLVSSEITRTLSRALHSDARPPSLGSLSRVLWESSDGRAERGQGLNSCFSRQRAALLPVHIHLQPQVRWSAVPGRV